MPKGRPQRNHLILENMTDPNDLADKKPKISAVMQQQLDLLILEQEAEQRQNQAPRFPL